MIELELEPTVDEVEQLIARIESILVKWKGNRGYVRGLEIERFALQLLLDSLRN